MEVTEETINELKNRSRENIQSVQQREDRLKWNEESLRVLQDNNKDRTFVSQSQEWEKSTLQT